MSKVVVGLVILAFALAVRAVAVPAAPPANAVPAGAIAALARAHSDARSGDPEAVQRRYDLARTLEEKLAAIRPTPSCRALHAAFSAIARGSVVAAEGFDRRNDVIVRTGERTLAAGLVALRPARSTCVTGVRAGTPTGRQVKILLAPLPEEAFFGEVRLHVPTGTRRVELRWRGRPLLRRDDPPAGVLTLRLPATGSTGRGALQAKLETRAGHALSGRVERVWLLPASARRATRREREDAALAVRLASIAAGFRGFAGIYVHELATGRTASWNAGARFPAASTVKLGVLAAALDRWGPRPEQSAYLYDLRALAAWSSNLAANRLLRSLGSGEVEVGRRLVEWRLRRLGATASTYPGEYRVGTIHTSAPLQPPPVSTRTTTAADLGHMLATMHAAAAGSTRAQRSSGLSQHEARIGIALLLDSEPSGENVGLFRPWLPRLMPAAQKHGWISSARHSAAVIYGPRGPIVVSLLTYRDGLALRDAQLLGRRVVLAALR
jgi:beta-lactamase class A